MKHRKSARHATSLITTEPTCSTLIGTGVSIGIASGMLLSDSIYYVLLRDLVKSLFPLTSFLWWMTNGAVHPNTIAQAILLVLAIMPWPWVGYCAGRLRIAGRKDIAFVVVAASMILWILLFILLNTTGMQHAGHI